MFGTLAVYIRRSYGSYDLCLAVFVLLCNTSRNMVDHREIIYVPMFHIEAWPKSDQSDLYFQFGSQITFWVLDSILLKAIYNHCPLTSLSVHTGSGHTVSQSGFISYCICTSIPSVV